MSVPIIAGAGSLQLAEVASEGIDAWGVVMFAAGFVSSAAVGYLAIKFFLRFVAHHTLRAFAYYRFGLAVVVAVALLLSSGPPAFCSGGGLFVLLSPPFRGGCA